MVTAAASRADRHTQLQELLEQQGADTGPKLEVPCRTAPGRIGRIGSRLGGLVRVRRLEGLRRLELSVKGLHHILFFMLLVRVAKVIKS